MAYKIVWVDESRPFDLRDLDETHYAEYIEKDECIKTDEIGGKVKGYWVYVTNFTCENGIT